MWEPCWPVMMLSGLSAILPRWVEMDGGGWRLVEEGGGGWRWVEVGGGGWRWMEVGGGGWRWVEVDRLRGAQTKSGLLQRGKSHPFIPLIHSSHSSIHPTHPFIPLIHSSHSSTHHNTTNTSLFKATITTT